MKVTPQKARVVIPIRIGNLRGAGDAVALVAEPIKHLIQLLHPGWNCGGCPGRRAVLNRLIAMTPPEG